MAHPIVMPSFGMYTSEGTLAVWLRDPGIEVKEGEPVLEIETDKATFEVVAPAAGVLHQVAERGAAIQEQAVLGYILGAGEAAPGENGAGAGQAEAPAPLSPPAPVAQPGQGTSQKASPIARRLAAEHKVDVAAVLGTGPGGRIVEADVLAAVERRRRVPMAGMRRAIAQRLRQSLDSAVSLTLTREVDAGQLAAARRRLGVPYDALFAKIVALALKENAALNARVEGDEIVLLPEVHIGFAVALEGGLTVPVIRNADAAPLEEIARQVRELTVRARAGQLKMDELEGGTATITNLGAQQIDAFTPVLNPPQACILGIGRIRQRPVVRDGQLAVGETCVLSLTFDHRVADGAPAAALLESVNRLMNDPQFLERGSL